MIAKTFELRDAATFVPVLAVKLEPSNEADRYLLARAGYRRQPHEQAEYVVMWALAGGECTYDPHDWGNRTRQVAHAYIIDHFDQLESGAVVDVEFILGERGAPKRSEAETARG